MAGVVLIATYNERENIVGLIERILSRAGDLDVLVVDDASPDGTAEEVGSHFRSEGRVHLLVRRTGRGYGKAMAEGFRFAMGRDYDWVVTMDADFSHDPGCTESLADGLEKADIVVGSRYVDGGRVVNWDLGRRLLSKGANWYVRNLLQLPVRDCTSGFRAYRRAGLERIDPGSLKMRGYAFLVEILCNAVASGLSVVEHPIVYTERRVGQSKMSKAIMFESALAPFRLISRRVCGRPKSGKDARSSRFPDGCGR